MGKKGKRRQRSANKRILILCEGITEKYYFEAMKDDDELKKQLASVTTDIVDAKNTSPLDIYIEAMKRVKEAQKEGNAYNLVWLVFDHDNEVNRKEAYDKSVQEDFKIAFSSMCFEVWYLLHFNYSTRSFTLCEDVVKQLKIYYKNYKKAEKNKRKSQNHYLDLKDKQERAIKNANRLRKAIAKNQEVQHITDYNPWCDIDILVNELKSL